MSCSLLIKDNINLLEDVSAYKQTSPVISFLGSLEDSIFYNIVRFFYQKAIARGAFQHRTDMATGEWTENGTLTLAYSFVLFYQRSLKSFDPIF